MPREPGPAPSVRAPPPASAFRADEPPQAARASGLPPRPWEKNNGNAAADAAPRAPDAPARPWEKNNGNVAPASRGMDASAPRPWEARNGNAPASRAPEAPPPPLRGIPAGATPLSRTTEPAPTVRITNVRKPEPPPGATEADERLFPEEGSAEGCASGECLPDIAPPEPEPDPVQASMSSGRDNASRSTAERWRAAVESVKAQSPRHGMALANGRLMWLRTGEIGLAFRPQEGFHRLQLTSPAGRATLDKALAEHFGRPVKLVLEDAPSDGGPKSLAEEDAQSRAAHEKSTEGKVRSHPAVRSVLKFLGGEIEHIQVYEPERPAAAPAAEAPEDSN